MATITDATIRSALKQAQASGKPVTLKDPGPRGAGRLMLQVRPGTSAPTAEWYAVYYQQLRRQLVKIGNYPATQLAAARDKFRTEYAPAILAGKDPRAARIEAVERKRTAGTVEALFKEYVDRMKAAGKKSWGEYENALLTRSYNAADVLGRDRLAADVTTPEVSALLAAIYRRGSVSHADHMRAYLHAAFEWALKADNDYRKRTSDVRWGITSNPVSGVPRDEDATKEGERHLTTTELRRFWRWLEGKTCFASRVLMLQIATGQRVQMLCMLGPSYYKPRQKLLEWTSIDMKKTRPHVLPLPRAAMAVLNDLDANEDGLYFPQPRDGKKWVTHFTVADLCREYCAETGCEPFSPRDIRRTWKTLSGLAGIDKGMRDRLQAHALQDVGSKHYDKYDYLREKQAAMGRWSKWLDAALRGPSQRKRPARVHENEKALTVSVH